MAFWEERKQKREEKRAEIGDCIGTVVLATGKVLAGELREYCRLLVRFAQVE